MCLRPSRNARATLPGSGSRTTRRGRPRAAIHAVAICLSVRTFRTSEVQHASGGLVVGSVSDHVRQPRAAATVWKRKSNGSGAAGSRSAPPAGNAISSWKLGRAENRVRMPLDAILCFAGELASVVAERDSVNTDD